MPLLLAVCVLLPQADYCPTEFSVLSLCWPTESNTEQVTCCRSHPTLFSLSDGTGMAVASAAPESPMEVLNEPGTVFHCSDECFVPLYWSESGMKEGFVSYPAENRRARVKLNDLSRALEKRVKKRRGRINPQ